MEQKELNLAICKELERIAKDVFDSEIIVGYGSYSISELASNKKGSQRLWEYNPEWMVYDFSMKERFAGQMYEAGCGHAELDEQGRVVQVWDDHIQPYQWIYSKVVPKTRINAGAFSCEIPRCLVFDVLQKFYSLAGVGASKRMMLTKEEVIDEVSLDADFTLTKDILNLTPFCKDKTLDAYFKGKIWIDVKRQCAVSTNGHTLAFTGCEAMLNSIDEGIDEGFAIDVKEIKRLNGKCHAVRTTVDGEDCYIVTDENGVTVKTPADVRYPRWTSAVPKPLDAAMLMVDTKKMIAALRGVGSTVDYKEFVAIHADRGNSYLTLKTEGSTVAVPLITPANHDVCIGMKYSQLVSVMSQCDGRLYIYDITRAMMLGRKNGGFSVLMPMLYEDCPKRCESITTGRMTDEEIQSACHQTTDASKKVSKPTEQPTEQPTGTKHPTPTVKKPTTNLDYLYSHCDKATLEIVKAIMAA